jgi:putative transposase
VDAVKKTKERVIGCDLGVRNLLILSNGIEFDHHPSLPALRRTLLRHKRRAARQTPHSHRWLATQALIRKTEQRIANAQRDHANKIADFITGQWRIVCIERTAMGTTILRSPEYKRAVEEANWDLLVRAIKKKAKQRKVKVVDVAPFFTSQDCSRCGYRQKMPPNARTYDCPQCGLVIDRDVNAAINVKNKGIRKLSKEKPIPFPPF